VTAEKEDVMADTEQLTREEGDQLLSLARKTIEARMRGEPPPSEEVPGKLRRKGGTFVTLTMDGSLRGCIGHIVAREPIFEGVKENAVNAAFCDPRFRPLTPEEWERVRVEVSVLTDPQPLPYDGPEDLMEKLRVGVDGLIIRKGPRQSTFLPQVWEQLQSKEEFLTHLCLKAGLAGDAWKREPLEVFTYQVQAFEE
jgi:AmmeMemoRadiSam system protein A